MTSPLKPAARAPVLPRAFEPDALFDRHAEPGSDLAEIADWR
jgi:hypothetical protein